MNPQGIPGKVKNILQMKGAKVFSVSPRTTVFEALEKLVSNNIGALVVAEQGKLKGIFTERDYARKVILKGKSSKETSVEEVMDYHPIVHPDTSVEECMNIMVAKNMRHLPILENDEIIGVVSMGDLVEHIMREQRYIIESLEHYINATK
jgi:CBS domain-containing protein